MLVFTRKLNEAIMIGDGIEVRILRVGRDGVRIGVTAPADIAVHRGEIYEMVSAANASAAVSRLQPIQNLAERLRVRASRTSVD
jgi:carbon storage regulator